MKKTLALTALLFTVTAASAATSDDVARLSADVTRAEDLRAVKNLQVSYSQYAQMGLWSQMAALFTDKAEAIYGTDDLKGRAAIGKYYLTGWGGGHEGLVPGAQQTRLDDTPVINLSADGKTAKGRWHEFAMTGQFGAHAEWAQGIMENEYVKEGAVWKIARLHYYPVFAGSYETGWKNVGVELPIIPYHYTPDEAGVPIPQLPANMKLPAVKDAAATLAALDRRISALNDEDKVRNLQAALGYYVDRKMWDDAADLYADDAVLEVSGLGVYVGPAHIHHAFERNGPQGLLRGQLYDHPMFDITVTVAPDGQSARARGTEFTETGDLNSGIGALGLLVFDNSFVKGKDGIWRIHEERIFPIMSTDYYQGWGKSRLSMAAPPPAFAPDRPTPDADIMTDGTVPVFFQNHPVTGKPVVLPKGTKVLAASPLTSVPAVAAAAVPQSPVDPDKAFAEARRKLALSTAWDGVDNITHAFGNYIDDFTWKEESQLYAADGWRGKYLVGFYAGPQHIEDCERIELGDTPNPRKNIDIHWLTQPVINVSSDGKSATMRHRLFHLNSSDQRPGVLSNGMYPNNAAVLQNGVWKFEAVAIDEPYFGSSSYADGWARFKERPQAPVPGGPGNAKPPALMQKLIDKLPPDVPLGSMPVRYHGFMPGDIVDWPEIKPMWFSYANPVSGRLPPFYCPNLKTCEKELERN